MVPITKSGTTILFSVAEHVGQELKNKDYDRMSDNSQKEK
jgi:hypothetical protein